MNYHTKVKIHHFRTATDFRSYKKGECIFREGEHGKEMFAVRLGLVDIRVGDKTVATLEQDETFGEMAIVDKRPRSATAIAATDCEIVPIDSRHFLFLVSRTPDFALQMLQVLATRLREMDASV